MYGIEIVSKVKLLRSFGDLFDFFLQHLQSSKHVTFLQLRLNSFHHFETRFPMIQFLLLNLNFINNCNCCKSWENHLKLKKKLRKNPSKPSIVDLSSKKHIRKTTQNSIKDNVRFYAFMEAASFSLNFNSLSV